MSLIPHLSCCVLGRWSPFYIFVHTYIHIYLHISILTCIHTYMHILFTLCMHFSENGISSPTLPQQYTRVSSVPCPVSEHQHLRMLSWIDLQGVSDWGLASKTVSIFQKKVQNFSIFLNINLWNICGSFFSVSNVFFFCFPYYKTSLLQTSGRLNSSLFSNFLSLFSALGSCRVSPVFCFSVSVCLPLGVYPTIS